ncbi:MAG: hypothetical protein IPH18_12085 [Chitinophagaceae bacterium]|nr:hypothetical protein [Chitinophagaceae bacterium]
MMAITCLAILLASCNEAKKDDKATEPVKVEGVNIGEVQLPIPLEKPYRNWQIGSTDNVVAAMNSLKTFIDSDFTAMAATIGDSLYVDFDNYQSKMSRDSAVNMFKAMRPQFRDLKIAMYDYVSVISADKSEEWVTFWYKQWWKNDKGVADSMNVVNDVKLKNGKMIELDEKTSHFQAKK